MIFEIVEFTDEHRPWARNLLTERWGSTVVVSRGKLHHADTLPGFVAMVNNEPQGLVTFRIAGNDCEVVTLDSLLAGRGIGSALLETVRKPAETSGCSRIWLITTNDNTAAIRFYQKRGYELVALHRDAIQESRKLKPEIPETGNDGIPIRDELEFEIQIDRK